MFTDNPTAYIDTFTTHLIYFLSGSTFIGIVAHAVNTFPMPKGATGRWLLGVVQYAVGQRLQANNTLNGHESVMVSKQTMEQARDILSHAPIVGEKIVPVIPGDPNVKRVIVIPDRKDLPIPDRKDQS